MQQTKSEEKFYITLHPNIFPTRESFNLARITRDFKMGIANPTQHTIEEILKLSTQGRAYLASFIENADDDYYFVSSRLMILDIDDDDMVRDPLEVLAELSEIAAGIFFTSSHLIKGFRYRILFPLDRAIRSQEEYKAVFKALTARLISRGIPADKSTQDGLQRIRTAFNGHGYVLGNVNARLPVDEYLELAKKAEEKQQNERRKNKVNEIIDIVDYQNNKNAVTYAELEEMAEHIGYLPSNSGLKDDWTGAVYGLKNYANSGMITQEEGERLFHVISGGEKTSKVWNSINPTATTIGTFIHVAQKYGYKRKFKFFHGVGNENTPKNVETVKFERHIDKDFMKELLMSEQQILIDAATGTGKTSSVVNAAKELSFDYLPSRYYLFVAPMRAIAKQAASKFDSLVIVGEMDDIYSRIKQYSDDRKRIILSTYDMASRVVDILKQINPFSSFTLIMDEIHHEIASYSYRAKAIEELRALRKRAKGFIGLSGTCTDILKEDFDRHIKIKTNHDAIPCLTFGAITWSPVEGESGKITEKKALIQLIRAKVQKGKRLLVFAQNKALIKDIKKILDTSNINTATISSETKNIKGGTYDYIVERERFPSDVQVILSTSAISDGVNIEMHHKDMECIVVCSRNSRFFDPSFIRQCAARFRETEKVKHYQQLSLFMPVSEAETKYMFNIESAYSHIKKYATNAVELLNSEFERLDDKQLAPIAALEEKYGIYIDEQSNEFKYNPLKLRELAYLDKVKFFEIFRNKFIEACADILAIKAAPAISVDELLKQNEGDVSKVAQTLEILREAAKQEDEYKRSLIKKTFTRDVYKALQAQDENEEIRQIRSEFKKASVMIHYNALAKLSNLTDYETCLKVLDYVTSNKNMYLFKDYVDALCKISYFKAIKRNTPTKKVFMELKKYVGKPMTAAETKDMIKNVADKLKLAKDSEVKKIYQTYFMQQVQKTEKDYFKTIEVLTIEYVAKHFDVTKEIVFKAMQKNSIEDTKIQRVILEIQA